MMKLVTIGTHAILGKRDLPALKTATKQDATTTEQATSKNDDQTKTTTTNDKAKSTNTGKDDQTTTKKKAMPHLTSKTTSTIDSAQTSFSYSSSSSSHYTTPTIDIPSAKGNPYVWSSDKPTGTVFIAVGAVAGFLFLAVLIFLLVNSWITYSQAKQLKRFNNIKKQFQNPFIDDIDFGSSGGYYKADADEDDASVAGGSPAKKNKSKHNKHSRNNSSYAPYKRASHSMIRLLGGSTDELTNQTSPSVGGNNIYMHQHGMDSLNGLERVEAIDVANLEQRKSLYISPTMEVVNQQRRSTLFNNLNQSVLSMDTPDSRETEPVKEPPRTVSPERRTYKHEKNASSLSKLVDSTIDLTAATTSQQNRVKTHKKNTSITPSEFLEHMLEDDD